MEQLSQEQDGTSAKTSESETGEAEKFGAKWPTEISQAEVPRPLPAAMVAESAASAVPRGIRATRTRVMTSASKSREKCASKFLRSA